MMKGYCSSGLLIFLTKGRDLDLSTRSRESPYAGRILRVDLSIGRISKEQFDPNWLRKLVGGNGVGVKILYDEVPPGVDPYNPENRLILTDGPVSGTSVPGSGTIAMVTKGPLTNLLSSTQANGYFGARLRLNGYDIIVIQGTSPEWKYLWIHDGEVEIRSANHLLGLDAFDTEKRLKEDLGQKRASVACIGPSGENGVKFAAINCDHGHFLASNGPGAVMGSKKLKAIVVYAQKTSVEVWDPDRLKSLARGDFLQDAEKSEEGATIKNLGTHGYFKDFGRIGGVPVKNLTTSVWPGISEFYGENIRANFKRKPRPCHRCPWAHCSDIKVIDGPLAGFEGEEPEFEGLAACTSLVGVTDPATGIKLSNMIDRMGMDVKETGYTMAMAIECYEKGIIGPKETGGIELKWGNANAIAQLIEAIAYRRGFGDVLADGVMRAAERIGGEAPNFAVYIKRGIAPHVIDGRCYWPILLSMSLGDTGSFTGHAFYDPQVGNVERIGLFDVEKIPPAQARYSRRWQFNDAIGMCRFFLYGSLDIQAEVVSAATGWDFTAQELLDAGERIAGLQRVFNIRHGLDSMKDDTLSPRLASAPVDGYAKGKTVGPVYSQMVRTYYRAMGWDEETSKPLPVTLHRLGLDDFIKDLW